jgi:hypothetical protein
MKNICQKNHEMQFNELKKIKINDICITKRKIVVNKMLRKFYNCIDLYEIENNYLCFQ